MTLRKDHARDALLAAMPDILQAYGLPLDTDTEEYVEACLDALPALLDKHGIDPDVDREGFMW